MTISVWLVVMLVAYVASIGPAIWLATKGELPKLLFTILYFPLRSPYELNPEGWVGRVIEWWL